MSGPKNTNLIASSDFPDTSVSLEDLGTASNHVDEVITSGRPKLILKDGVPVAAIIDAQSFEEARAAAARELLRDLQEGLAAADAGDLVDHEDVLREMRERFRGRVPDSVLAQFGNE